MMKKTSEPVTQYLHTSVALCWIYPHHHNDHDDEDDKDAYIHYYDDDKPMYQKLNLKT